MARGAEGRGGMRIRQIKPSFWTDSVMASLPYATRLFYVGLWGQADDAGWLRWDPYRIGCELYGGEPRGGRERRIEAWRLELEAVGRLVSYPCGHAQIPHLTEHQHLPAFEKRVNTELRGHERNCGKPRGTASTPDPTKPPIPVSNREEPRLPDFPRLGKGKGKGMVNAREAPENDGLKARLGEYEDIMGTEGKP
jgi:hypothetical protein